MAQSTGSDGAEPGRPNILWIVAEDHGPHMGCYGDEFANTPNVDQLARRGMCFDFAWSNAPVCASARTTLWMGLYGTSTGGEHMRSMAALPANKKMFPELLREAGYYCAGNGKEDYNLPKSEAMWDESPHRAHWSKCPKGKPCFAYFNNTESHEGKIHDIKEAQRDYAKKIRDVGFIPEHERLGDGTPPFDFGHNESRYPLDRVLETAELASSLDPIVRYWAAMGMVMRNENAVFQSQIELLKALSDSSPDVQIAAAWAIAKHASPPVASPGLAVLAEYAPRDRNNTLLSMAAPTALDDCGTKAESLRDAFTQWPMSGEVKDDLDDARFKSQPRNLMKSIQLRFGVKVTPVRNQAGAKK